MNHVIVVMNFIILVAFSQQSPPVIPLAESVASDPDSALPASAQWWVGRGIGLVGGAMGCVGRGWGVCLERHVRVCCLDLSNQLSWQILVPLHVIAKTCLRVLIFWVPCANVPVVREVIRVTNHLKKVAGHFVYTMLTWTDAHIFCSEHKQLYTYIIHLYNYTIIYTYAQEFAECGHWYLGVIVTTEEVMCALSCVSLRCAH